MDNYKVTYAPYRFDSFGEREINAVTDSLKAGWLGGDGPLCIEFEKRIAAEFGKAFGLAVNSGSSANLLALSCLELPKGSRILTPACTFSTTLAPVVQCGYEPQFCDVGLDTYVPDVATVLEQVSDQTKAILLPNLIGNSPDWKALKEGLIAINRSDILLIEDSADTIVSGPYSDISTTSFYPSHIISAGGLGGMVMFNNEELLNKCGQYRDWGRQGDGGKNVEDRFSTTIDGIRYDQKYLYSVVGHNLKMAEMNAAFGLAQLQRLSELLNTRRQNFNRYVENLQDIDELLLPDDSRNSSWLAFPMQTAKRMDLVQYLESEGIQTRLIFAGNITRHPAYRQYLTEFENADKIMSDGLMVGLHQGMTTEDVDFVCEKIRTFFGR